MLATPAGRALVQAVLSTLADGEPSPEVFPMRKAVQFQVLPPDAEGASSMVVLCDDGILFELSKSDANDDGEWRELPPIPQDEEPEGGDVDDHAGA